MFSRSCLECKDVLVLPFSQFLFGFVLQVFLLSFCLIIFPSVNPFGGNSEQKELYTPSSSKFDQKTAKAAFFSG